MWRSLGLGLWALGLELQLYVVGFAAGQVGDLPHGGLLTKRSQIGLPLFQPPVSAVSPGVTFVSSHCDTSLPRA
jgi:hypothetical protein